MPPLTPSRMRLMVSLCPRNGSGRAPQRASLKRGSTAALTTACQNRQRGPTSSPWRAPPREPSLGTVCSALVVVGDLALGDLFEGHGQVVLRARADQRRRELVE